jgi:hypothetical protein
MGRTFSMNGNKRNSYSILVGKLGKPRPRWVGWCVGWVNSLRQILQQLLSRTRLFREREREKVYGMSQFAKVLTTLSNLLMRYFEGTKLRTKLDTFCSISLRSCRERHGSVTSTVGGSATGTTATEPLPTAPKDVV